MSAYTDAALKEWTRKIRAWKKGSTPARTKRLAPPMPVSKSGRDVFVYFDNDVKARAPFDAMSLAHRLGLGRAPQSPADITAIHETARRGWPEIKRRWKPE
jgi:uncharacterized protein YecE (DUF72 family)